VILVAPAVRAFDPEVGDLATLPAGFTAAAVAGLVAALAPQSSPTNKVLPGIGELGTRFSYGELKDLLQGNVCPLEDRQGIRVVRASRPKVRPSRRSPPAASSISPRPASARWPTRSSASSTTSACARPCAARSTVS